MNPRNLTFCRYGSVAEIGPEAWRPCETPGNPFLDYDFLLALEESRSVGPGTGWEPRYLALHDESGLAAVVPAFLRSDSWGEYIFDFQWAGAYEQAGLPYYPKITVAAPFTPATGERFLVRPGFPKAEAVSRLAESLSALADDEGASSVHILFCTKEEQELLSGAGYFPRLSYQFHWTNAGYRDFDGYLDGLRSQKRKHIRRERKEVAATGLEIETVTDAGITPAHLDALWRFYQSTHLKRGSQGYLTREFFRMIPERLSDRTVIVTAKDGGAFTAGTLNFQKGPNLYGRYWGSDRHYPFLHFELCFYRLIEHAIATGKTLFEAGAQGEHKFLRGFAASPTYSAHWIAHPGGRRSIGAFLEREQPAVQRTIEAYNRVSPLKRVRGTAPEDPSGADGGAPESPTGSAEEEE